MSFDAVDWHQVLDLPNITTLRNRTDETANNLLSLLSKQKPFVSLPYETRVELSRCLYVEKEPKKGTELISQHEILHRYTGPWRLIVAGSVEVRVVSGQGKSSLEYLKGECFGDSLTLRALPPATTFLTGEEGCAFLTLANDDYQRLLSFREAEVLDKRVKFFRSLLVPLFASWSTSAVRELAKRVYRRKYTSRQVIVRENEPGGEIYFIVKGECRVVREIEIVKSQGGVLKKMVKLLELAVLHPCEYFGELAPCTVSVDQNGKYRNSAANGAPQGGSKKAAKQLLPPVTELGGDEDMTGAGPQGAELTITPETPGPRQATVFSYTPLEVLVFPVDAIKEVLVGNPLQRMREYAKGYPTSVEIKNQHSIQHDWQTFKLNLVKDIIQQ